VLMRQLLSLSIIALIAISTSVELSVRSSHKGSEHRDSPKITTTVDWNAIKGTVTSLGFGVNAFQGFRPDSFNSSTYQQNMLVMKPGLIRFHNGSALQDSSTPDGLIDSARKSWDVKKVKSALAASVSAFGQQQPQRMINIPTWPDWMDADRDGFLDRDRFDDYARLCADLVKIVNRDAHFKVKYWEITNEKDDRYFTQFHSNSGWGGLKDPAKPDRLNDLIAIYNQVASAMKKVDRNIRVGGPGISRADLQPFYVPFIKGTVDRLDFFSYHFYATGSADTPDAEVFNAARKVGDYTASIVKVLKETSPTRKIPAMLDEYNISWTWETRDPRMTNHKGVVFDALSTIEALSNGAIATLVWNEKDGIYGKMDDQCQLRIGGHFLKLMNQFTIGDYVLTATNNRDIINSFAVRNPGLGRRTYLSINRSNHAQQIQIKFTGWSRPTRPNVTLYLLSSSGYIKKTVNWSDVMDNFTMPANSVILITGFK
jgi:Glycosyl hydrolases family 39